MLGLLSVALPLFLLAPRFLDEAPPAVPIVDSPSPVALVASPPDASPVDGFDRAAASRQVLSLAAARLKARGVLVQPNGRSGFLVTAASAGIQSPGLSVPPTPVTLTVGFGSSTNPRASGTETRFGGGGDSSWRLALQVQRQLVRGLRDVLGYDSFDRGEVEREDAESAPTIEGEMPVGEWVAVDPLFSTNAHERDMLAWPETLDLISAALANAVTDYLNPSVATPGREARLGWREATRWWPLDPRLVMSAEGSPRVALTFDGGASAAPTPAILKALRDAGVRATMFMTAEYVERNPDLVVQMVRDGHELGNHSATHPDMTKVSSARMVAELDRLERDVYELTGRTTRPWFRPPFGAYDDRVLRVAGEQGYYSIYWTADSADWRDDVSPATVESRLLRYATDGAILIEHLGSPQSAQVLAGTLRQMKERGITFGTLSEVLGRP